MGILIALVIALVIALIAVVVAIFVRRKQPSSGPELPAPPTPPKAEPVPMTGLEAALDGVTDRTGRPIREAIDAEAEQVAQMRLPDDTGPLLRRALDHVARPGDVGVEAAADGTVDGANATDPDAPAPS